VTALLRDASVSAVVAGFVARGGRRRPGAAADHRQRAGRCRGDEAQREVAIVTFLGTASGVTLAGIGAAFRGLCAAALTLAVLAPRRRA